MKSEMAVAIAMFGLFLAFISASNSGITVARFAAFISAYGMLMAAFKQIDASLEQTAKIGPILKTGEPILQLMRLMLGFETPAEGTISYDGRDLETLDMSSFRRNVGTVLPGGKLFQDNVYSNITISAPWLKMEEAWKTARMVGMEEDIQNLPDGMQTIVHQGSSKISDGLRQKLLIARAIAPGPSILMFDSATSALDNIARKTVCDMLKTLDCTRVVITQYPSEIRECDRILVLDSGKIAEEGTYDELMARNSFFTELVSRQDVDATA